MVPQEKCVKYKNTIGREPGIQLSLHPYMEILSFKGTLLKLYKGF